MGLIFKGGGKPANPAPAQAKGLFVEFDCPDAPSLDLEWNYTDRAERIYRAGHRCLVRGFFSEALTLFERAVHYDRSHYAAYVAQAETLILMKRTADAARVADEAMSRYGRNCALGAARGHVFLHQNDAERALECAEIATQNDPGSAYAWLIAGEARVAAGVALPNIMKCFARSSASDERWPNLNVRIALAYLEWGHEAYAIGFLKSIVAADPNLPLAWMLLGDSYRKTGKYQEARASYRRAIALVPNLESARAALGWRARVGDAWRAVERTFVPAS
jgi:tetratricopeptide (TPR) repeat protein